jgi:hypothetical protein
MSHAARLSNPAEARAFALAGNATFTLVSTKSGTRFTYRIRKSEDGKLAFVHVMTGPDNENAFQYLGYIRDGRYQHGALKARVTADAPSAKAFSWFHVLLSGDRPFPDTLEFWHEGRCGRCRRKLTVPESIASGIGPECAKRRHEVAA